MQNTPRDKVYRKASCLVIIIVPSNTGSFVKHLATGRIMLLLVVVAMVIGMVVIYGLLVIAFGPDDEMNQSNTYLS